MNYHTIPSQPEKSSNLAEGLKKYFEYRKVYEHRKTHIMQMYNARSLHQSTIGSKKETSSTIYGDQSSDQTPN